MSPEFGTAYRQDARAVAELVNRAYRPLPGAGGWTHESALIAGRRIQPAQVTAMLNAPNSVILTARLEHELAGCVHLERKGNAAHIGMLSVVPDRQGAGLGKQLLAHAETYATTWFSPEKFVMAVLSPRTELIDFYRRRGYAENGTIGDYPREAGVGVPRREDLSVIFMEKRV